MVDRRRILIQGIGGIGGPLSASLIKKGYNITLITNNSEITQAINHNGIIIKKGQEQVRFYAQAHTNLSDLHTTTKYDIIFLLMKATAVEEAVRSSLDYIKKTGYFVSFQNGIVEDRLTEIISNQQLISAIVGYGGTMHSPGIYEKTSQGTIHIGELDGSQSRRLAELKTILENVEQVVVTTNINGVLWSKLAINCAINSLGALTGQVLGDLLRSRKAREIFIRTYSEVVDVAHAEGVELEKIAANPYLLYRDKDAGMMKRFVKDLIIRYLGRKYRHTRSSTYQSLKRKRKSEIDFLNGYVVNKAEKHQFPVPMNTKLLDLIHQIENGQLSISTDNIQLIELD